MLQESAPISNAESVKKKGVLRERWEDEGICAPGS